MLHDEFNNQSSILNEHRPRQNIQDHIFYNGTYFNHCVDVMELTELDKQLQQIALSDWQKFVAMIGEDAVVSAKVCLLRRENRSYGQIKQALKITKERARYVCKHC